MTLLLGWVRVTNSTAPEPIIVEETRYPGLAPVIDFISEFLAEDSEEGKPR